MIVGIFVGGRSVRMGGTPKGLLPSPESAEPIAGRLARLCRETFDRVEVVLVGDASAYATLGLPAIGDAPEGVGPIGGLRALLLRGSTNAVDVIALAGDLPFVTSALLRRLERHAPGSAAVAPRIQGFWQPLFARYAPTALGSADAALASGKRALRDVIEGLGASVSVLPMDDHEEPLLRDWDSPEDLHRHGDARDDHK